MSRDKCNPGKHSAVPLRGGRHTRCVNCGDVFPCRHTCEHFDCRLARGEELPEWVVGFDYADAPAVVDEAFGRSAVA